MSTLKKFPERISFGELVELNESQATPVEAPPAQELNLRVSYRPDLYPPIDLKVWRMTLDINDETGYHCLTCYNKAGEEVFSHDACTLGIKGVEFLDSRYRDADGNLLPE